MKVAMVMSGEEGTVQYRVLSRKQCSHKGLKVCVGGWVLIGAHEEMERLTMHGIYGSKCSQYMYVRLVTLNVSST